MEQKPRVFSMDDDITDEDIRMLQDDYTKPASHTPSPNEVEIEGPASLPRLTSGELDLRRADVNKPVFEDRRTGRMTKYPWNVWQDGKVHVAVKGHNFSQSRVQFVTMMHNRARGHDQFLATRLLNDTAVEFCFFKDKGARDHRRELWRAEEIAAQERYKNEAPE